MGHIEEINLFLNIPPCGFQLCMTALNNQWHCVKMSESPCFYIIQTLSGQICLVSQFISNPMFVLKEKVNQKWVFCHYLFLYSMSTSNVVYLACTFSSLHSLRQFCVKCIWNLMWCISHLYWCGLCPCSMLISDVTDARREGCCAESFQLSLMLCSIT